MGTVYSLETGKVCEVDAVTRGGMGSYQFTHMADMFAKGISFVMSDPRGEIDAVELVESLRAYNESRNVRVSE